MLNEEAVRLLGYESPEAALGQQVNMEVVADPLEIIGVVRNYHQQSLSVAYKPIIFFMKERIPFIETPYISIRLTGEGIISQCSTRTIKLLMAMAIPVSYTHLMQATEA